MNNLTPGQLDQLAERAGCTSNTSDGERTLVFTEAQFEFFAAQVYKQGYYEGQGAGYSQCSELGELYGDDN